MEDQAKYEVETVRPRTEALVEVEQQRAIAETQAALIIAKRFPRNPVEALDRIINSCTRTGLAEAALYQYARGGTDISGPSIRLAEAIAQNWQNLQFGIRELEQRNGMSTVEAYAWDVENNTKQIKTFQVKHERHTKQGSYKLTDPRDIYEQTANQGARRLRTCILGIIPGDVVEAAVKQCEITLKTKANVTTERIASLLEKFGEFSVTKEQIETRIQRHIEAITPAQMVNMGKIYNSLKDGMSTAADWFDMPVREEAKSKVETLKDKLRTSPMPEPQPTAESPVTAAPETPAPIKCPKCGLECASERGLKKHMTQSHTESNQPKSEANDQGTEKKTPPASIVDWGVEEKKEPEDWFMTEATKYKLELVQDTWDQVLGLYGMKGKDLNTLALGYREAFLARCKAQLDKQNTK